jgi:hypothetical protein
LSMMENQCGSSCRGLLCMFDKRPDRITENRLVILSVQWIREIPESL